MTRTEHLLDVLIEECAEVIQRATKAKRFGLQEIQPEQEQTNLERLLYEANDLAALIDMIEPAWMNEKLIDAKKDKVERFLRYPNECGTLTEKGVRDDGQHLHL